MPPALDRLLASPSALRLLRSLVTAPELPVHHTAAQCCATKSTTAQRRTYAKRHAPRVAQQWRQWSEQDAIVSERKNELESLRNGKPTADVASRQVKPTEGFDFLNDILGGEEIEKDQDILEENPDELWATRLARQERLEGLQGIWWLWHARRREGYRLPTENSANAQYIWGTFARHPKLVPYVIEHAAELMQEKGETYPRVYSVVMGYWLARGPAQALEYHHQMLLKLRLTKLPLRELAQSVQNYGKAAQEALLDIYRNSNERDLYNEVVPRLIECKNINMARRWHNLCTFRNDLPSGSYEAHPVIQLFTAEGAALTNPNPRLDELKRGLHINQRLMQRLLGRDTAPVRFEDAFTARMFATRTVQTESIIKGLTLVGVNEIGPLAVSAMARRTQPITDLPVRFEELRAAGIALQGSVFSLALEKFAMEKNWELVQSMLDSDQHPDVFGDADTQRSLLHYYLEKEDLQQAQRTLAILTLFHNDPGREAWNLLLQLCFTKHRPENAFNTMLKMRGLGISLSKLSMVLARKTLVQRQRGHRPQQLRSFDDLRFVTRFYVTALEGGIGRVPPEAWHEIIRRFGMQGRFRELKRLLLWLLSWYAPRHSPEFADLPRASSFDDVTNMLQHSHSDKPHYFNSPVDMPQRADQSHPIRTLFPPSLQQGILVWGFRSSLLRAASLEQSMFAAPASKLHHRRSLMRKGILKRSNWDVGLRLLVQLRDLNVHIHEHTVTKTLQAVFINLFGHGHSRIKANRIMERSNTIPYVEYVRGVNEAWGKPLLTEPQLLERSKLMNVLWHPRFRRRVHKKGTISLRHTMGEEWAGEKDVQSIASESGSVGTGLDELKRAAAAHASNKRQ
ncbi:hypothetical protein E8E13_011473 [Curvularia kusanoi]|uniref:Pentatricopeptide repeat domain-containing protein n=1 Tax=Curvularia kusanoi TaxID=90978 RepID=A0A9P4WET4_CURKU|nr:hypothetical protein E8E13_011473 [Curvularia kusanoi]